MIAWDVPIHLKDIYLRSIREPVPTQQTRGSFISHVYRYAYQSCRVNHIPQSIKIQPLQFLERSLHHPLRKVHTHTPPSTSRKMDPTSYSTLAFSAIVIVFYLFHRITERLTIHDIIYACVLNIIANLLRVSFEPMMGKYDSLTVLFYAIAFLLVIAFVHERF